MSLRSPFTVIRIYDPAVDLSDDNAIYEYAKHREGDPPLLPGKKPAVFHCRPLRQREMNDYVLCGESDREKYFRAFQCSLVSVENWQGADVRFDKTDERLSDDDMDRFGMSDILEVGCVAFAKAYLPLDSKGGYLLPDTSVRAFVSRRMEESSPPAAKTTPTSESSESPAASPMQADTPAEEQPGTVTAVAAE